jgi:hypothetical protein
VPDYKQHRLKSYVLRKELIQMPKLPRFKNDDAFADFVDTHDMKESGIALKLGSFESLKEWRLNKSVI